jgi:hypothetical protein
MPATLQYFSKVHTRFITSKLVKPSFLVQVGTKRYMAPELLDETINEKVRS